MGGDWKIDRDRILREGTLLAAEARRLQERGEDDRAWNTWDAYARLRTQYVQRLPRVVVARCPFTAETVSWAIDTAGLDGWFWDEDNPCREVPEVLPRRWLTMTGAMRLSEPLVVTPFASRPGPSVPFVLPNVLEQSDAIAVISECPVGSHTGWPITYFGHVVPDLELANLWGSQNYPLSDDEGQHLGWHEATAWPPDFDYDLARWIAAGRVKWIAPGDATATLRSTVEDCPYVGLSGPRGIARIQHGVAEYWDPPAIE